MQISRKPTAVRRQPVNPTKKIHSQLKSPSPKNTALKSQIKKSPNTPLQQLDSSNSDVSQAQKQDFLMLEIKQLKRQNNFLKKKISEMTIQMPPDRKARNTAKGSTLNNLEIVPLSINIVFQEIHNLLNTIVKLFRVEFTQEEIAAYQDKFETQIAEICPIKRYNVLRKYHLKRKLEKIMLGNQEQRYPLCLQLFTQYYGFKQESDQKIIQTIDNMTLRAHQLNQLIMKKVQDKQKSRGSFSILEEPTQNKTDTLKVPVSSNNGPVSPNAKNFVARNKANAYSPANNNNNRGKKTGKYAISSVQRTQKT